MVKIKNEAQLFMTLCIVEDKCPKTAIEKFFQNSSTGNAVFG